MIPIIDLHQDLRLPQTRPDIFREDQKGQTSFDLVEKSPISLVVASGFPYPRDGGHHSPETFSWINEDFQTYIDHCNEHENWRIVSTASELEEVVEKKEQGILMHVEGLNAFLGTEEQWEMLQEWYEMGWRSLGMVWNLENSLAGGARSQGELTDLGKEVLSWCSARNIVIDLAHMNEVSFQETLEVTSGPVVISHGNARQLCKRPRNYTKEQMKAIGERGGVIGVFFSQGFLIDGGKGATIETIAEHIEYIIEHAGVDAVALGTDFGGNDAEPIEGMKSVTDIPNLFDVLKGRGHSDEVCEKIGWKNAYRVLRDILPG